VPKFTSGERHTIEGIVSSLSIKRIPDLEIIKQVFKQTNKNISRQTLYNIKQRIKKEASKWYSQLREGEYEYIYEFKERINEIYFLQKKHYEIIDSNENNPSIQQASLIALHKLNVTLSNYFDVAPFIKMENHNVSTNKQQQQQQEQQQSTSFLIDSACTCIRDGRDTIRHNKCRHCFCTWCPTATGYDWCPNPDCSSGLAGCKFEPYDEHQKWIKYECGMWFKTQEIIQIHQQRREHSHIDDVNK
jgi:hypothetical protein